MRHLGSALLRSELLVLLLVLQLFRPVQGSSSRATMGVGLLSAGALLAVFFVSGRWWTRVFFGEEELSRRERILISIVLSGSFIFFSIVYRKLIFGVVASWHVLTIVVFRMLTGEILAVHLANTEGSSR